MNSEIRSINCKLTAEKRADGDPLNISGYAAVFDSLSEDLGGFREVIAPGAFAPALAGDPDIRALFNHNTSMVLGRTTAQTLTLGEDNAGLRFSVNLPDVSYARDLHTSVARGDISGASFAFRVGPEDYDLSFEGDEIIRRIRRIPIVFEVSVATNPAYVETQVSARSYGPLDIAIRALEQSHKLESSRDLYLLKIRRQLLEL